MEGIDLLILHGPPGAGKSSIAKAIGLELRKDGAAHTIIEMDDLAEIYPKSLVGIMYRNLAAIWPNYVALGSIRVILPTYLQRGELEMVMTAAPAGRTTVCEVTAPAQELERRINDREPVDDDRKRLLKYLKGYADNRTPDASVDFRISNFGKPLEEVARAIISKVGWTV